MVPGQKYGCYLGKVTDPKLLHQATKKYCTSVLPKRKYAARKGVQHLPVLKINCSNKEMLEKLLVSIVVRKVSKGICIV